MSIPVRIALAVWFLYTILEWRSVSLHAGESVTNVYASALVGMAAMVLLFPIPGYIAKLLQSNSKEQMKKVRVRLTRPLIY